MTDLARGPLGAFLPSTASLPDSTPLSDHDRSRSQPTDLDIAQTEQWETDGGANDTDPLLRLTLAPSASLRHVQETYEQKLEWTRHAFAAAQARWEARPKIIGPVTRDDEAEEPASKAAGNRARVAFLSIKGATMQGCLAHGTADPESGLVGAAREPEQTLVR